MGCYWEYYSVLPAQPKQFKLSDLFSSDYYLSVLNTNSDHTILGAVLGGILGLLLVLCAYPYEP